MAGGAPEGRGVMLMPDGTRYEGGWKAGRFEGEGVLTQANGDRYEGAFVAGRREGSAARSPPTATSTRAASTADMRSGAAELTTADGRATPAPGSRAASRARARSPIPTARAYEGAFVAGRPHGQGVMIYADQTRYEGEWAEGAISGQGKATYAGGLTLRGRVPRGPQPRPRQADLARRLRPTTAAGPTGCATARPSWSTPTAPATRAASRRRPRGPGPVDDARRLRLRGRLPRRAAQRPGQGHLPERRRLRRRVRRGPAPGPRRDAPRQRPRDRRPLGGRPAGRRRGCPFDAPAVSAEQLD